MASAFGKLERAYTVFELIFLTTYCIYCWCFLTPSLVYYAYRFYSLRRTPTINKRHHRLVRVINIAIGIYIVFSKPSLMFAALTGSSRTDNCFKTHINCSIAQTISDIADSISSHGWPTLLLIRLWLIYFETTYNDQFCEGQWVQFINPKCIELQANSLVYRVRNTLGKEQWVMRYIFTSYYVFSLCIGVLLIILLPTHKLDAVLKGPVLILFIILWYKTPKNTDALKVHHEMKLILAIVGVDVICFITYSIIMAHITNEEYRIYCICVFQTWFATGHLLYALCTTKWVLTYSGLHVPSIDKLRAYVHSNSPETVQTESLAEILSQRQSLNTFMTYLCSEWSMESLLCIIECCQFKAFARNNGYHSDENELDVLSLPLDKLPQSAIVYDSELSLKEKLTKIVRKYVSEGSTLQVNIGHDVRCKLESLCEEDKGDINYYLCFDVVLIELFYLIQDSYFRFVNAGGLKLSISEPTSPSQSQSPPICIP
eukprot:500260_1